MPELLEQDGTLTNLTGDERAVYLCAPYLGPVNLNIGCGRQPLEPTRWVNIDKVGGWGAEVVCELGRDRLPFPDDSVSCVFASHVLEHIVDIIGAMREIHRVLVPGGVLVACTPYASSDGAWDDPTHVRAFTRTSWQYYDQRLYAAPNQAGHYPSPVDYCFDVLKVDLIPELEFIEQMRRQNITMAQLERKLIRERNIVLEMQAHLRAVKG